MLKYAPWTLSRGYNIEKGNADQNVKIGDLTPRSTKRVSSSVEQKQARDFVHSYGLKELAGSFQRRKEYGRADRHPQQAIKWNSSLYGCFVNY